MIAGAKKGKDTKEMIEYILETITPEKARTYLSMSKGNRNIHQGSVDAYARDMASGKFQCTHQAIAFYDDGTFFDGHHRLNAVIKANVAVEMMVARNVPCSAVECIDTGDKRSVSDVIYYSGSFQDSPALRNKGTMAALCNAVKYGYRGNGGKLSNAEKIALIEYFRDPCQKIYCASISRTYSSVATVRGAALSAIMCGVSFKDIFNFFSVYTQNDTSDCYEKNYMAVLNLRRQVDNAKIKRLKIEPSKLYNMTQNAIWNFCNSTGVKTIKETEELRYPVKDIFEKFFTEYKENNLGVFKYAGD